MSIDWKLFRTLVRAGATLILVHGIVSHWSDFKRGFMDGYTDAQTPAAKDGR